VSSQLLLLLKFSLLALLYLFLLRVVRAVWAEVSTPAPNDAAGAVSSASPADAVAVPVGAGAPGDGPGRGRGVPKSTPPTGAVATVPGPAPTPSPAGAPPTPSPAGAPPVPDARPGQLVVVAPPELAGRSVEVGAGGVLVGRGSGCDLVVEDTYVSQRHLRISEASPDAWWVEDLGSTNGTFIGGDRVVAPRQVGRGMPVSIGGVVLELR